MTTVSQLMTRGVRTLSTSDTVLMAAQVMDELNVGVIPVVDGDKLVGVLTDRDIVVRAVARSLEGKSTRLSDVMSANVHCVAENEPIDAVLGAMAAAQIRRMPVVDGKQRLVGIVTIGDIAVKDSHDDVGVAASLADISAPAAPDRKG
jgi:CBS domain-containing protein